VELVTTTGVNKRPAGLEVLIHDGINDINVFQTEYASSIDGYYYYIDFYPSSGPIGR
jgi:hypothetical protein